MQEWRTPEEEREDREWPLKMAIRFAVVIIILFIWLKYR